MTNTITSKMWLAAAMTVVAGTVGLAGVAAAAPTDDVPTPIRGRGDRAALVCGHIDEIDAKMAGHLEQIGKRQTWLAAKRAQAVEAGHDRLVERIDRVSARLVERTTTVNDRISRLDAWAADHCDAA